MESNVVALPVESREPRAYVLGGNASTLAFVSSLRPVGKQIVTWLVPLAWTPIGVVLGENWQRVGLAADNVVGWIDQTFPPEDERSFVTPARELDILQRVGWHAEAPERLSETSLLNPDDVPEDVLDAIAQPPVQLTQCAACRRSCVRGDFEWNEGQLCAWDYHATVFGKRGPWRSEPYESAFSRRYRRQRTSCRGYCSKPPSIRSSPLRVCPRTSCRGWSTQPSPPTKAPPIWPCAPTKA